MPKEITQVEALQNHRLLVTFRDGERREIDIAHLVSFTGIFAPLQDPAYFRRVTVNPDLGTIVWPNGADLCPDVLYAESRAVDAGHAA
jgi:hypothetical protein